MKIFKYLLVILVLGVLVGVGYLIYRNSSSSRAPVNEATKPEKISSESWDTYSNAKYGIEMLYPTGLTVDESFANNGIIRFDSVSWESNKLGSLELFIYDSAKNQINTLDDAPRYTKDGSDRKVSSTKDITTANGLSVRIIRGVQYPIENGKPNTKNPMETASIMWMYKTNTYVLEWGCSSFFPICFNDAALDKLVQSIKIK